jgi:hypothetical protein
MSSSLRGGNTFDNSEYAGLNSLSASELKRLLIDRGVDFRDCLEKRDLVERLMSSKGSSLLRTLQMVTILVELED